LRGRMLRWALAGGVVLVGIAGWASLVSPVPLLPQINMHSGETIRPGMTRAQVEVVLGGPGDYRTRPTYDVWLPSLPNDRILRRSWSAEWYSDEAHVLVLFDQSGCVKTAECLPQKPNHEHPLDNALWNLRRQWRCWFSLSLGWSSIT
jgi:hypothetical protein